MEPAPSDKPKEKIKPKKTKEPKKIKEIPKMIIETGIFVLTFQ